MKAKFFAVFLSLFVITIPAQAVKPIDNSSNKMRVAASAKIDLNKADIATLTGSFKGIGKKRAAAIIAYRESHQGFKTLEELGEVKGIGQRFIEVNLAKLKEVFIVS